MKQYIKDFTSFIKESSMFIPRNVESRMDDLKKQYTDKGYKLEDIFIGDIVIKSKEELLNNKYKVVIGEFHCYEIKLTSLKGCPEIVNGQFSCADNNLTSLEFGPKEVTGYYQCEYNSITSLIGCPEIIGGNFYCDYNRLTTLEGCPKKVGGSFHIGYNGKNFSKEEIKEVCNVKGNIHV